MDGIDYAILDEFARVLKRINLFVWCSKNQILDLMNYFVGAKHCLFEILVWHKTNPAPATKNTYLPDLEYCLHFRERGVLLNDGYELKSKCYIGQANIADKAKFLHPTIKPLPLVERHLLHATQPNDIVLDAFCGSGTTLVACKNTSRQFIGFDIKQEYVDIANNRLNNIDANGQLSLFTV